MKATMAWRCRAYGGYVERLLIIMVNIIPSDQHDDVPVIPEPVLVDEDEDPEVDPFNPPLPAFESEPKDVNEAENPIVHEDETVPASVHEMTSLSRRLCGRETVHALVEKKGKAKDKYYGKLILDLGNEVISSVEQGTATKEKLVEKLGNAEEKAKCKRLKKELEEARFRNISLHIQNERVKRDLYWTRIRAHEFYQEMIRRGFVFEERPNEAINFSIKDEKSPSSEIMPPKSKPLTQAAIRQMIKESVDAAIAAERARHANAGNDARGSGPVRGQDAAPVVCECTFAGFMKCNPIAFHKDKKVKFDASTLQGPALTWCNDKVATIGLETVNQMPWTEMK
ncbi:hypothetical protein Tco_1063616 [Tanacetum coccineum]